MGVDNLIVARSVGKLLDRTVLGQKHKWDKKSILEKSDKRDKKWDEMQEKSGNGRGGTVRV